MQKFHLHGETLFQMHYLIFFSIIMKDMRHPMIFTPVFLSFLPEMTVRLCCLVPTSPNPPLCWVFTSLGETYCWHVALSPRHPSSGRLELLSPLAISIYHFLYRFVNILMNLLIIAESISIVSKIDDCTIKFVMNMKEKNKHIKLE